MALRKVGSINKIDGRALANKESPSKIESAQKASPKYLIQSSKTSIKSTTDFKLNVN